MTGNAAPVRVRDEETGPWRNLSAWMRSPCAASSWRNAFDRLRPTPVAPPTMEVTKLTKAGTEDGA